MLTPQQRLAGLTPELQQRVRAIETALQQQRVADAERDVVAALALAPRHPEVLRLCGMIQGRRGRMQAAIQALQQAFAQRPDDALICNELGGAYERTGEHALARAAFQRASELAPQLPAIWFNLARRLQADGEIPPAIAALQRAVELQPRHFNARAALAEILRTQGRFTEAAEQYRGMLAIDPRTGSAWWNLAQLKPLPLTQADLKTMREVLRRADVASDDRIAIHFAIAMANEHAGDFSAAFAAMQSGHALAARAEPYDAVEFSGQLESIVQAFAPAPAPAAPAQGEEIIFIASLPRSGSTLTEQILASHSQVEGTSELHDLGRVITDECARLQRPFTEWARTHAPPQWHALGQAYLARTQRWRAQRPRMTDKMPANWMYVGAILAMLPQARVVICRRDPLETCLACYRYIFAKHPYTHDFAGLAAHWRDFDRAVRHWQMLHPEHVRVQVYEDLVADPEARIRDLLTFCGLPFEAACLDFHATERRVNTPSAAQVREPLRRDTARADRYGALLDPLRTALGLPPFQGA
jgi:Flp pilus assembly protein TadD